eukprot:g3955.t1
MPTKSEWRTILETAKVVYRELLNLDGEKEGGENTLQMSEFLTLFHATMTHGTYFQDHHRDTTGQIVANQALLQEALRWMKFSCAACGWAGLIGMGLIAEDVKTIKVDPLMKNKSAFETHIDGVTVDDVVSVSAGGIIVGTTLKYPCHAIVVDHRTKSVVIAVRGTMSVTDAIIDLMFDPASFPEVHPKMESHKGILGGAREIYKLCEPTLKQLLLGKDSKSKGYKIVVTGHSLGGGTTYTLGLLLMGLRDDPKSSWELPRDVEIQLWAFAPPPMVSDPALVPTAWRPFIRSFVFNDDIVPRASIGAARELISWILALRKYRRDSGKSHSHDLIRAILPEGHEAALREAMEDFNEDIKRTGLSEAVYKLGKGRSASEHLENTVNALEAGTKFGVQVAKMVDDITGSSRAAESGVAHVASKWNNFFSVQKRSMEKYKANLKKEKEGASSRSSSSPATGDSTTTTTKPKQLDLLQVKDVGEIATHVIGKWNSFFGKPIKKPSSTLSSDESAATTTTTTNSSTVNVPTTTSTKVDDDGFWQKRQQTISSIRREIKEESVEWARIVMAKPSGPRNRIDNFKLCHPGQVFYLYPSNFTTFDMWEDESKWKFDTHGLLCERSCSSPFEKMIPSSRCFENHLPSCYEWALRRALRTIVTARSVRVIGADWCPDCVRTKKLLRRLGVSFEYDSEGDAKAKAKAASGSAKIPCVKLPGDAGYLNEPSDARLAKALEESGLVSKKTVVRECRLRVIGADWCPDCVRTKKLLCRLDVSFEYDSEGDAKAKAKAASGSAKIPCVELPGGAGYLNEPSDACLAKALEDLGLVSKKDSASE